MRGVVWASVVLLVAMPVLVVAIPGDGALPQARQSFAWTTINGSPYLFGGDKGSNTPSNDIVKHDGANWVVTADKLPAARWGQTAVWTGTAAYIFGGHNSAISSSTKEVVRYVPGSNAVTMAIQMPENRDWMASVWNPSVTAACPSGCAYLFGGGDPAGGSNKIIRFSVAGTGTFQVMGAQLPSARWAASAAWDGQYAYIGGGGTGTAARDEILRYDPATDTISQVGSMGRPMMDSAAMWSDGALYFAGGLSSSGSTWTALNSFLRWRPGEAVASWSCPGLPAPVIHAGLFARGSSAWVVGGQQGVFGSGVPTDGVRDVTWTDCPGTVTRSCTNFPSGREMTSAAWNSPLAYVFGGQTSSGGLSAIMGYNPSTDNVATQSATLPGVRWGTSAFADGSGNIYVLGGDSGATHLTQILKYVPATQTVTPMFETLPTGRSVMATAWDGTNAYLIGGWLNSGMTNQILRYTPSTGLVAIMPTTLPQPMSEAAAIWDGAGNVYIFGGSTGAGAVNTIYKYTPATNILAAQSATLPMALRYPSAVWDGLGNAYLFGGQDNSALDTTMIQKYTPSTQTISVVANLPNPARARTSAVWDSSDRALIFTGRDDATVTRIDKIVLFDPDAASVGDANVDGIEDNCLTDADGDGVPNGTDNCPTTPNSGQQNADLDSMGDACDADSDGDSVPNVSDNCPTTSNASQTNSDVDAAGDACDTDDDNDGVLDGADNCPVNSNAGQGNNDNDGVGDVCDPNDDTDGTPDTTDNCPLTTNWDQADADGDGQGNMCDADMDGDGVPNVSDNCPSTSNPTQTDTDTNGIGNACEADLDGDGISNSSDNCPSVPNTSQQNTIHSSTTAGDACEDFDSDSIVDISDNCPSIANAGQANSGHPGTTPGDACEDPDGDLVMDASDNCPDLSNSNQRNLVHPGTFAGDVCDDPDGDLVMDRFDNCPDVSNVGQANTIHPSSGLGDACEDFDADTVVDLADNCPSSANSDQADSDANGVGDTCEPLSEADCIAPSVYIDTDGNGLGDTCVMPISTANSIGAPWPNAFEVEAPCLDCGGAYPVGSMVRFNVVSSWNGGPWTWDFGDGSRESSNLDSTSHTYSKPGVYKITLITQGAMYSMTGSIVVRTALPVADFSASPQKIGVGAVASFKDASSGTAALVGYEWQFGDGTQSSGAEVSYTFLTAGKHTVQHVVRDSDGAVGRVARVIEVYELPVALIQAPDMVRPGASFTIDGAGSTSPGGFALDFEWTQTAGPTVSMTAQDSMTFVAPKVVAPTRFSFSLVVSNDAGDSNAASADVLVDPLPPPTIQYVELSNGAFEFTAIGAPPSVEWDFGDGTQSDQAKPSHRYVTDGRYEVQLRSAETRDVLAVREIAPASMHDVESPAASMPWVWILIGLCALLAVGVLVFLRVRRSKRSTGQA